MKKKTIKLTVEQARELLGKDEAMDVLIRANFTDEELKPKVTRWEDFDLIEGWYVNSTSQIREAIQHSLRIGNRNIFATKEQAEGVLAMAQLSQLMKHVNGDWKPDWMNDRTLKYVITFYRGEVTHSELYRSAHFLVFRTPKIRDKFAEDHRDLILEYFKIYQ